jgi:hypothetical protein
MSFDIFLQSFKDGEATQGNPEAARLALEPYLAGALEEGYARIRTADGEADVYGVGSDSLMFNHAGGESIWQVMVDVARAAEWVIMPVGFPVCVMREDMISELPAELQDAALVISSGADLRDAIAGS